ncbi:DUF695 domain-containing protein [Xanthomonas campestris pv. raphani]|uniref:DUF695 domain-containing protein n=1 Tax=Xanthomonas campestris TaxID=339 RepID=UPI0015F27D09|nr:DUF695 domain-containing protein [Xanthomonas campestris]MEA9746103.1 DUF695 domain-containing protein [Xanthomonas campestris pv. raphani]MEA9842935.1 DUF695 domain-containing protein [Xanthomonas campestris pv. raphani]MEA9849416.1 DUF695 domain-containing protein [Xanthomonas campestris pv. raphani]MEA9928466.1 DUF695 domain-containing protein [Xanthomonas campestris pv. raphani]
MKRRIVTFLAALSTTQASSRPSLPEQWWTYMASYDDGPGSIRLNLALRRAAPEVKYPNLIVTGTTYTTSRTDALPEKIDAKRLNDLQERIVAEIAKHTPYVYAGTFTHNFEQLHYVYVKIPDGIQHALSDVYASHCPGCKVYTNIKQDPSWYDYSDFLFPNEATREHYGLQLD